MTPKNIKKEQKSHKPKRLVLLDAHAIIHRAYHALPDFSTSKGEPTGAVYGLVSMVLKIAADLNPDYLVACFDLPKPTYRHEVYEGYKAGRVKAEEDLKIQIEKSKDVCLALNIPVYSKEGFEADDLLGTIVEKMKNEEIEIIIASGDMDTMQLVSDGKGRKGGVKVYTLKKGISDTILYDEKAVRERFGFEPEFLPDFKGLRGDPSDNITGVEGIGEKTATELVKKFKTIENLYSKLKSGSKEIEGVRPRVIELLKQSEEEAMFSKMLATIRRDAAIDFKLSEKSWKEGVDLSRARNLFAEMEFRKMADRLEETLGGETRKAKPERIVEDYPDLEEVKVALWVVDSNITDPDIQDIYNFAKTDDYEEAKKIILSELRKREVENVFEKIEKPLVPIVEKMQKKGVLIEKGHLSEINKEYSKEIEKIGKSIWKEAGAEFNISSPKQLGEILFDKLGITIKNHKKTGMGVKSTKESELEKMKNMHPIIPLILEYRELSKLVSTYIEPIPKMLDSQNRLHARFVQTGTTTGRMSSQNPNLQNIPISTERGRAIRKAFVAPKGFKLAAFDYSQIELRIAAFLSGDRKLIDIFKNSQDIHAAVATRVFNVPEERVDREMRRQAKVINFGILYGMGISALQVNLGTDRKTASEFLESYFKNFDGLARYLDRIKDEVQSRGFTETAFGRRRYFEGIKSNIPYIRASAERMAINAPMQGTQADIIKIAMKRIDDYISEGGFENKVFLILQIHDELVYEIESSVLEEVSQKLVDIMQSVEPPGGMSGVPIVANASVGDNWGEMERIISN
jgi:DNA polymerase-1